MVSNPTQLTLYAEWLKVRFITQVKINIHRINQLFCFVVSGASSPLLLLFFHYTPPLIPWPWTRPEQRAGFPAKTTTNCEQRRQQEKTH